MNCSVSLIIVLFSSFYQKKYLSTLYYVKRTIYTIERFSNPIQIHEFIRTRGKMWIWLYWADLDWSYRTTSFCLPKTIWFSDSRHSKRMTHTQTWWWATFINVSINQSINQYFGIKTKNWIIYENLAAVAERKPKRLGRSLILI